MMVLKPGKFGNNISMESLCIATFEVRKALAFLKATLSSMDLRPASLQIATTLNSDLEPPNGGQSESLYVFKERYTRHAYYCREKKIWRPFER